MLRTAALRWPKKFTVMGFDRRGVQWKYIARLAVRNLSNGTMSHE
jgi:hypothetical protein